MARRVPGCRTNVALLQRFREAVLRADWWVLGSNRARPNRLRICGVRSGRSASNLNDAEVIVSHRAAAPSGSAGDTRRTGTASLAELDNTLPTLIMLCTRCENRGGAQAAGSCISAEAVGRESTDCVCERCGCTLPPKQRRRSKLAQLARFGLSDSTAPILEVQAGWTAKPDDS